MRLLLTALLVMASGSPTMADEPPKISAHVSVQRRTEPGQFEVYVRVSYAKEHIAYTVATYCDGTRVRHSIRQLDEFSRPPELPVVEKNLGGCDYLVVAMLHGAGGAIVDRTPAIPVRILCFPCENEP